MPDFINKSGKTKDMVSIMTDWSCTQVKENDFQIGDEVEVIYTNCDAFGKTGKVIKCERNCVRVEIDGKTYSFLCKDSLRITKKMWSVS